MNEFAAQYAMKGAGSYFFAVYDGHGGKFVSKYFSNNLHNYFLNSTEFPFSKNYVYNTFAANQNILKTKYKKDSFLCGSTCLVVVHYVIENQNYINIFNVGDSRCIL